MYKGKDYKCIDAKKTCQQLVNMAAREPREDSIGFAPRCNMDALKSMQYLCIMGIFLPLPRLSVCANVCG